jgi:hypothetical protein
MNKNLIYGVVAVVALGAAAFFFMKGESTAPAAPPRPSSQGSASAENLNPPEVDLPAERTASSGNAASKSGRLDAAPPAAEEAAAAEKEPQAQANKKSGKKRPPRPKAKSSQQQPEEEFEQPQEKKQEKAKRF